MATRSIKDAKDKDTGELFYFRSHAKATFMSNGVSVEDTVSSHVPDAPLDGKMYARQDGQWVETKGGSSSSEILNISLDSNYVNKSDLIGATIYLKSNGEVLKDYIWNGSTITQEIPAGTSYTVEVSDIASYSTPSPQSFTAMFGETRNITMTYITGVVTVNFSSNQGVEDSGIDEATVTLTSGSTSFTLNKSNNVAKFPYGSEITVSPSVIEGYSCSYPETVTADSDNRSISLVYQTEVLTVNVSVETGESLNYTITVGNIGSQTGATGIYKIPFNTNYTVSASDVSGYKTPASQTIVANQASRTINLVYEEVVESIITINQSSSDPAAVTVENPDVVNMLLSQFRRCLCKKVSDNNVKICYLDDSNSNYYADGAAATLTGSEGDVMVYFPEMYYKCTDDGTNLKIYIALDKVDDTYKHCPASLVGAYKARVDSNKLYSYSGVESTGNVSMANFSAYARARGAGYHLIDYMQHRIIAWMFYARYKTRDSQGICGTGKDAYTGLNCGTTNSIGITDTTTSNAGSSSSMHTNFLGIEGCWGYKYEWIEGIHSYAGDAVIAYDKGDAHDTAYSSMSSSTYPTKRKLNTSDLSGWISKVWGGEYGDMTIKESSGSETTYYCDYGNVNPSSSYVFYRSDYYANTVGGVAYLSGGHSSSYTDDRFGSRLAFDGTITEVTSSTTFKALAV